MIKTSEYKLDSDCGYTFSFVFIFLIFFKDPWLLLSFFFVYLFRLCHALVAAREIFLADADS